MRAVFDVFDVFAASDVCAESAGYVLGNMLFIFLRFQNCKLLEIVEFDPLAVDHHHIK